MYPFSSNSAGFEPSKWQIKSTRRAGAVDADCASLHRRGKTHSSAHVSGINSSIEPVLSGVYHTDHLILRSENSDINHQYNVLQCYTELRLPVVHD